MLTRTSALVKERIEKYEGCLGVKTRTNYEKTE